MMEIPLDEVVYFDVITSTPSTGAAVDADSTPTFAVYEEATDTDIGVGGNLTKRTSLTGNYRGSFTASSANGFEVGKWYSVIASATVGAVAGKCRALGFRCTAAENTAGYRTVDTAKWNNLATVALPLIPTTPGNSLDVTATGAAGIDWGNIENKTTTNFLTATTILTATNVETDTTNILGYIDTEMAATLSAVTDIQSRLPAALSGGLMKCDIYAISTDTAAADNLEAQFDGTGLTGDTYPASQLQLDSLANTGSAGAYAASTYVLTTGTQSANTYTATRPLDGIRHEHTDTAGAMDLYYQFSISTSTPTSVTVTGYLNGANDSLEVYGYDWVAAGWVQIGVLAGKGTATNDVNTYTLFTDMVGTGANLGIVRIRFTDGAFTLTTAVLAIDQIYVTAAIVAITSAEVSAAVWNAATATYGTAGSYGALIETNLDGTVSGVPAALLDLSNGIETGITLRQATRAMLSESAGKLSGAATATNTFRNAIDTKDRITATVDADGNRTAITLDLT